MNETVPREELTDFERYVLGSMIADNTTIPDVCQILHVEDFYLDAHQKIFRAIEALSVAGKKVDAVALAGYLFQAGHIEDVRYTYLGELYDVAPTGANAIQYAELVRDRSMKRKLRHAGAAIVQAAEAGRGSAEELIETAEKNILGIAEVGIALHTIHISEAMNGSCERIDKLATSGDEPGLLTGFTDLDEKLGGMHNSDLLILAARPSVGKTALGLGVTRNLITAQVPVFFASLEQARIELADRLISCQARVDGHKIRCGRINHDETARIVAARQVLSHCPMHIDDAAYQSVLRIAANARRLQMRHGIKLVVVDYLQLIQAENRRDPRHEQVGTMSRRLKCLAKELEIPVLCLCQLNRESENGTDRRPKLSQLRESGEIECNADTVMLMHRDGLPEGVVEVNVAKQRNGPTGTITLTFLKHFMRFENFAKGFE